MSLLPVYILIIFGATRASSDGIDVMVRGGNVLKFLRAMTNETKGADSLNLPANATSIRQNITDTFSCENRTYGYYADVDNDCQIFHVCLPSQTPSGRNVTYRWSFICPNETVFNQEVFVCTWPRDAIPCEESPMYYDLNMEMGRVPDDTSESNDQNTQNAEQKKVRKNTAKRPVRKQNLVVQNMLQGVIDDEIGGVDDELANVMDNGTVEEIVPVIVDVDIKPEDEEEVEDVEAVGRIVEERSRWNGRKLRRGGFRFKADV